MALFQERFINQVQQATDIVEVVSQYVALNKAGKEYKGLCPFHQDHRPSMTVVPAKQIYKCFACGAGGGVFQFLMQLQKISFPEAVRELAQRAGIPLPKVETSAGSDAAVSGETLVKITTFAARFYRDRLLAPEGQAAMEYAHRRRLTDESIRRFGLGYAPDSWDALRRAAVSAGYSDRQLVAAGLLIARDEGGGYDRFRNRLMFPILDVTGKVIAFGGRALAEDQQAKYLNSSETALFDKSANLYALNWSREGIARSRLAVVVEGYLDALVPLQEGLDNVVATLGTSLTERHVRLLSRYAREVVLVFDADTAGQAASERAIELFVSQRLNVRVATVPQVAPDGSAVKDPCDYVLAAGAEAFRQVLEKAPDAMEFAWGRRREAYRAAKSLAEKRGVLEEFLVLIVSSAAYGAIDVLRQGLLAAQVSELANVSANDVAAEMARLARRAGRSSAPPRSASADGEASGADRAGRWLLGALLNAPELMASVHERVAPSLFAEPALQRLAERMWGMAGEGGVDLARLLRADESVEWGRLVTDLQVAGERQGQYQQTVADAVEEFGRRRQRQEIEELKAGSDAEGVLRKVAERSPTDKRRLPHVR